MACDSIYRTPINFENGLLCNIGNIGKTWFEWASETAPLAW